MFYVRKRLPSGPIRFGVGPRTEAPSNDRLFSTGPRGEYVRRGSEGLYYSEAVPEELRGNEEEWGGETRWAFLRPLRVAGILVGIILNVLGAIVVIVQKDPIGYVEIAAGLFIIIIPAARHWKQERELRERERKERQAHAAEEARRRELVGAFATKLQALSDRHDPAALSELRAERERENIPYEAVSALARRAVVDIGFEGASMLDVRTADDLNRELDQVAVATGLSDDDRTSAKNEIYQRLLWHLLADNRLGPEQKTSLESMRRAFKLSDEQLVAERAATEELEVLAGLDVGNLPNQTCAIPLRFQEICHHQSRGSLVRPASGQQKERWQAISDCILYVTSKRVIMAGKTTVELPLARVFSLEIDKDENVLMITSDPKKRYFVRLADPIVTAGMIETAAARPRKPQGLV